MIVTLIGSNGKVLEYETDCQYFIDHIKLLEHMPVKITPECGTNPCVSLSREITFYFSHSVGGRCIYTTTVPEAL